MYIPWDTFGWVFPPNSCWDFSSWASRGRAKVVRSGPGWRGKTEPSPGPSTSSPSSGQSLAAPGKSASRNFAGFWSLPSRRCRRRTSWCCCRHSPGRSCHGLGLPSCARIKLMYLNVHFTLPETWSPLDKRTSLSLIVGYFWTFSQTDSHLSSYLDVDLEFFPFFIFHF